ncbi:5-dehydro-2-deoxygluconokinase [Caproiciproducens sp. NJN-50]|uniref:5-dehydro-2-deoxygluconokinase n=1 Tax=Acutalibacteraceae TaxID=3082771 RepID=UPI000FFE28A8|nr:MULTISPECIES: 5-dehydro-2-deoxygluconokinase [Acutalibacteraceae]QAT49125.1 5-dehydro-2-deoxygluconokinase [Caproiciproducens sp. NJN-50]
MSYINFDADRPLDLIALGRIAVDFNPVDMNRPLSESLTFKKYLGGSPANISVGLARLKKKVGFLGRISDDQMGDFVEGIFKNEGIDTSHVVRCTNGEKIGLTFTEILSPMQSSLLMYRDHVADLQLNVDDIDEGYIASAKALLISGTSLCESPSREAALKAVGLAKKTNTKIIFDIDYRPYNWKNKDEIAIYYSCVAEKSDIVIGSQEEFELTEKIMGVCENDEARAECWLGFNNKIVIIKHGKQGSTAYTIDGQSYSVKPFPVQAMKGFGGGDGYASSFLFGLFNGWEMIDCLEFGSASASMLVSKHSCAASMPTEEEVRRFITDEKKQYGEMVVRD